MYIHDETIDKINEITLPYETCYSVYLVNEKEYGTRIYIDERDICGVEDAKLIADMIMGLYIKIEKATGINLLADF